MKNTVTPKEIKGKKFWPDTEIERFIGYAPGTSKERWWCKVHQAVDVVDFYVGDAHAFECKECIEQLGGVIAPMAAVLKDLCEVCDVRSQSGAHCKQCDRDICDECVEDDGLCLECNIANRMGCCGAY